MVSRIGILVIYVVHGNFIIYLGSNYVAIRQYAERMSFNVLITIINIARNKKETQGNQQTHIKKKEPLLCKALLLLLERVTGFGKTHVYFESLWPFPIPDLYIWYGIHTCTGVRTGRGRPGKSFIDLSHKKSQNQA